MFWVVWVWWLGRGIGGVFVFNSGGFGLCDGGFRGKVVYVSVCYIV